MTCDVFLLLKKIPDTIWAAIIATALSYVGIWHSNRVNTNNIKLTLEHSTKEKIKERRIEIYLNGAEQLVKLNTYLSTLPQVDLSKNNIGLGFTDFSCAVAKLKTICSTKTYVVADDLLIMYSTVFFKLMPVLRDINRIQFEIDLCTKYFEQYSQDASKIVAEMTRLNMEGLANPAQFQRLKENFEFNQKESESYTAKRNSLYKQIALKNEQFFTIFNDRLKPIHDQSLRVLLQIRKDLDLNFENDAQIFQEQLNKSISESDRLRKDLFEKLKSEVSEEI